MEGLAHESSRASTKEDIAEYIEFVVKRALRATRGVSSSELLRRFVLSPLRGSICLCLSNPRLAPWAVFFRRSAARRWILLKILTRLCGRDPVDVIQFWRSLQRARKPQMQCGSIGTHDLAAERRKNKAHGASRGYEEIPNSEPRSGERTRAPETRAPETRDRETRDHETPRPRDPETANPP
jgi:hypothetical protein